MPGVLGGKTERRQGIGHDVGCRTQILARCGSQVHDALDTIQHISGLPSGHGHVLEGFPGFRCRELGFRSHLPGLGSEVIKVLPSRAGNGRDLAHLGIKVSGRLNRRSANPYNRRCHMGSHHLSDTGDLIPDLLELFPGLIDLFQRRIGSRYLRLQVF